MFLLFRKIFMQVLNLNVAERQVFLLFGQARVQRRHQLLRESVLPRAQDSLFTMPYFKNMINVITENVLKKHKK